MSHEPDSFGGPSGERLSKLFAAYREACPAPEPASDFTPRLWQAIEARQFESSVFQRFARTIITAAALATTLMGIYWAVPRNPSVFSTHTYLELLANNQSSGQEPPDDIEIVAAVHETAK